MTQGEDCEHPGGSKPEYFSSYTDPNTHWDVTELAPPTSDLGARLEELRRSYSLPEEVYPGVNIFIGPNGDSLSIGMTDDRWALIYTHMVDDFPYEQLGSLGNEREQGYITFQWGDNTGVPARLLVPRDEALDAVRHWIDTGSLSGAIRWTEDYL